MVSVPAVDIDVDGSTVRGNSVDELTVVDVDSVPLAVGSLLASEQPAVSNPRHAVIAAPSVAR
jgi:hypothetical protein